MRPRTWPPPRATDRWRCLGDAPDDGGSNITRYEYSTDNGTTWTSTGGTATSYTATQTSGSPAASLSNGTEYTFRVRAVNGVGDSGPSGSQTATPLGPPGTPGNLQVSPGNQEVRLTWNAAAANGANITRYEYSSDNGSSWRTTGSTSRSYTATTISGSGGTTLQNGTAYTFRVRALNSEGTGPQSNSQTATPTTNTVPGQVIGLMSSPGDGFLDLSWDEPSDGGSAILRYEYQTTNNPWESIGSTDTTFRATRRSGNGNDFVNGVFYGVRIRAVNATGNGAQSAGGGGVPNNQPPAFSSNTASRSVNENELSGTDVGAVVTATDPESDSINYSITGSNPGSFNIDSSSGQIETGQLLNHEATDSYTIRVRASATGGSDNIDVTITVNDVNETPSFASAAYSRSVNENVPSGSDVGGAVTASDPEGDTLSYSLTGTGASSFAVSSSGQITTAASIDYEATSSYSLTLTASDGNLSDTATVNITVNNVIEDAALTALTVPAANLGLTTARFSVALTNPDSQNTTVYFRYRTPRDSGAWTQASVSTTGTTAQVDVTGLTATSDYRVQASLSSTFPSSGRQQADFSTAANSDPAFPSATAVRTVDENAPSGTNVGQPVTAADSNAGDSVTYAIGGTDAGSFDLGSATGQITVGSGTDLDFETKAQYSVTITATDTHGGTDSIAVTIDVADIDEAGLLGSIVFVVGSSGSDYGYDRGSYGSLTSGEFPDGLFDDHTARTVEAIYENADAEWVLEYSGGTANDWLSDEGAQNAITVTVTYTDGVDTRSFVLGGFIAALGANNRITLAPPLPSRDWDGQDGETVRMAFHRHIGQAATPILSAAIVGPAGDPGSFVEFLTDTTPGGAVIAQSLIVILAYSIYLFQIYRSKRKPGPFEVIFAAAVLSLSPWVPVFWGYGDLIAGVIIMGNIALGAFVYKTFFARTEG